MLKIIRAAPQLRGALSVLGSGGLPQRVARPFSISQVTLLKEIRETREEQDLIIEGVYLEDDKSDKVLKIVAENAENKNRCSICALGLEVKHTDVLILSQFVRPDGLMLPRRTTGLCRKQQKRVSAMVTMAHKAGLMSNLNPTYSKKDPERRGQWKKFKSYFDESTIEWRPPVKPEHKWIWRKTPRYVRV